MTRFTPVAVSLFLLLGCGGSSAHGTHLRQAVARPPMVATPPAVTPGYFPGTPAEPVYTPNGAGLPGERVPGQQAQPVPTSPNKRILPASNEPGLWAADGAPRASDGDGHTHPLFGLFYPHPPGDVTGEVSAMMDRCAESMLAAAQKAGVLAAIEALPKPVKFCMSARAFAHCADATWDEIGREMLDDDRRHELAGMSKTDAAMLLMQIGRNNIAHHCRRAGFSDDLWRVLEDNAPLLDAMTARWKAERPKPAKQPKN